MQDHFYAVIMAGGGGTRLWPVSRKTSPKQMLRFTNNQSLFQLAIGRLNGLFTPEKIFVVTVAEQVNVLREECPQIPLENYLIEPAPRGTAAVVGLAASYIKFLDSQGVMAVLTADHIIEKETLFQQLLMDAFLLAKQGALVTLGIEPVYPSTGYGYIESGEFFEDIKIKAMAVKKFIEKPDLERAKDFLKRGGYYWNSGMFIWQVDSILEEFKSQMPILNNTLELLHSVMGQSNYKEILNREWMNIVPQTIDYGIMEHAKNVAVLPAKGLGWSDVGSWDSLVDFLDKDANGNVVLGNHPVLIDTHDTIIYQSASNRLCAAVGLEDLVIVDTPDAVLVCKRGDTQRVRQVVELLKQKELLKYL